MRILIVVILILSSCGGNKNSSSDEKKVILENIKIIEEKIKNDTTGEINKFYYYELVKNYNRYIYSYPNDSLSADLIFKSANLHFTLNKPKETLNLLTKLEKSFPNFKNIDMCLILKAETYLELLNDTSKAIAIYKEFLNKFPQHPLAKDIKMYIENIKNINLNFLKAKNKSL
ncbi:MAG: tetratricopeptide repeat protein [Bacteroidales bacterium]|nr:tetratricopeptide repeat protein [Bacteroidales bacterium]